MRDNHQAIKRDIRVEKISSGFRGMFDAMASPCELLIEADDPVLAKHLTKLAAEEAWRIEQKFSRYREDNVLHQINHAQGQPVEVDEEMALLLDFAQQCYQLSDGLFDITSGVLRRAWTFDCGPHVPTQEKIDELLPLVGWHKVIWQSPQLTLAPDMQIDLGGIGKEYAVDKAALIISEQTDSPVLLNFGGDLVATKAPTSRKQWQVGVESIGGTDKSCLIQLESGAIATSGDARRYVEKNGKRYSHVLNPKTGWSVVGAPKSITVAAPRCIEAGFLATLAMLQGEQASHFLDVQNVMYWIQE